MMHGQGWGVMATGGPAVALWLAMAAVVVFPFWRILPRAGIPAWLALLALIPPLALVLLWVMALRRWPGDATSEV